jgi:hypothetical protein
LFEVLLRAGVFVADLDAYVDASGDDPGGKDAGRRRQPPPAEDQLDLFGVAQVKVVRDQRLEERPAVARLVKDQAAGEFNLPHRQLPPISASPVLGGQRQRQPAPPPVEEPLNLAGPSWSQMAGNLAGSSQAANPLASPVQPIPAWVACVSPTYGRLPIR